MWNYTCIGSYRNVICHVSASVVHFLLNDYNQEEYNQNYINDLIKALNVNITVILIFSVRIGSKMTIMASDWLKHFIFAGSMRQNKFGKKWKGYGIEQPLLSFGPIEYCIQGHLA